MPTDAEIADRLRKLVKELERMDRREDRWIRNKLSAILDGEGEVDALRKEIVERIYPSRRPTATNNL